MSLAAATAKFKTKAVGRLNTIVSGTITQFSESLVKEWTPFGDPTLWKSPPPADYRPGNLQSSWFLTFDEASPERTKQTDSREMHGLEKLGDHPAGRLIFLTNNADHASSIEGGHSSQAPVGIMVNAAEFAPMVQVIARKVGA